jgi:hypothetical protein
MFMPYLISFIATASLIRLFYRYFVYPLFFSPLRHIPPAHPTARFTSLWISYHRRNGSQALQPITFAHATYGPIIRLSPTEISIASYEGAYRIYVERGGFAKPEWWANEFMTFGIRNLVSKIGGMGDREHRGRKRDLGPVYSKTFLVDNEALTEITERVLGNMVRVLDGVISSNSEGSERDGEMDFYNFNGAVNADFISSYQFGSAPSLATNYTLDTPSRNAYFTHHDAFLNDGSHAAQTWLENFAIQRCSLLSSTTPEKESMKKHAVVYNQLYSRGLRNEHLSSELLDHLMAGAEGPRTALTYLEYELSLNPQLQAKLRAELNTLLPPPALPNKASITTDFKALDSLPLLDALLTETLRVYTPTPGAQHRLVPPEGTSLHGFFIPGGTRVSASLGTLHANPSVFAEPEKWRPERWLEADGMKLEEMRRWFWAFNKGSRACVGRDFTVLGTSFFLSYAPYLFSRGRGVSFLTRTISERKNNLFKDVGYCVNDLSLSLLFQFLFFSVRCTC